jgi:5-deoxy-D-glucuronate isomerase
MNQTLKVYGGLIEANQISPVRDLSQVEEGVVFDPADDQTPLLTLGMGIIKLKPEPVNMDTKEHEYVLVLENGTFEVETEGKVFRGERVGGPFNAAFGISNHSAVYIPKQSSFRINGEGRMIYFYAPASLKKQAVFIDKGQAPNLSRGSFTWRRDCITSITPEISCNLIVGETYSSPGLWSGTPLHTHDHDDPEHGESDHEEIYYHVSRLDNAQPIPDYTVQLLFDGRTVNQAYLCKHQMAVAIPGACHPVVASPVSDHIYIWALAGKEGNLGMKDVPQFAYLKKIGPFIEKYDRVISSTDYEKFCRENALNELERKVVELNIRERGVDIV